MRLFRRSMVLLPVALLYGCSETSTTPMLRAAASPARSLLAGPIVIVTNTDDAGPGSLRQAIADAPDGSVIQFAAAIAGQTILLSTGSLEITKLLTIEGPVPAGMTISGGLTVRVFGVSSTANVIFRNLSIVNGREKFAAGMEINGNATLDHSLVANNETYEASGGGILVRAGAELAIVNSTISGNVALSSGGGIYSLGRVSIRNSTIARNSAPAGGGIAAGDGTISMRNSIVSENGVVVTNCAIAAGVTVGFAGRNVSDDNSCGTDPALFNFSFRLGALADNGGPTKTHAIEDGFALDGGLSCTETTDQRYVTRNQGLSCDIGAFEFNAFQTITTTINPNVAVNTKTGAATVTGTVKCSASTSGLELLVEMSQTQKTTGRFTEIVKGIGLVSAGICKTSPSSWSITLTPTNGKFEPGAATGTVKDGIRPKTLLPFTLTSSLKLFQVK